MCIGVLPSDILPKTKYIKSSLVHNVKITSVVLGHGFEKRPIYAWVWNGNYIKSFLIDENGKSSELPSQGPSIIIAGIHGNEKAAGEMADLLLDKWRRRPNELAGQYVILIPRANPDGCAKETRQNSRGVDLNRNFPFSWEISEPESKYYSGIQPLSESESKAIAELIEKVKPSKIISIHSPLGNINFDGPARAIAELMSKLNGYPVVDNIGYPTPGSLGLFAGQKLGIPTITLELPPRINSEKEWNDNYNAILEAIKFDISTAQESSNNSDTSLPLWAKPPNWAATETNSRKPYAEYYDGAKIIPVHDTAAADNLGLKWQLPLRNAETGGKFQDFGGVYAPTLKGRSSGGWGNRYKGIHRGHDIGISSSRLGKRKIPVHVVADGVFDGQRTYEHAKHLPKDCRPVVVYHPSQKNNDDVFTSVYCHIEALPELKPGTRVKAGDIIGTIEDPEGSWGAHVHLEIYSRPVYASKDSTKRDRCGCKSDAECDAQTRKSNAIPRGCGIFEDDLYLLEPMLFIKQAG